MKKYLLLSIGLLSLFFAPDANAQGILLSEYRMILNNSATRTLQVCNTSEDNRTFELSFVNKKMTEDGRILDIPDSIIPPFSIRKILKVFPKVVTLAPEECQEVQIQLKNDQSLPDGEYRSYLQVFPRSEKPVNDTTLVEEGFKSGIIVRVGVAIPIIYRKNCAPGAVDISMIQSDTLKKESILRFEMDRSGCGSVFGDIEVSSTTQGNPVILASLPGNAVYAEVGKRIFVVNLPQVELDKNENGECAVTITFKNKEDLKKKPITKTVFLPASLFKKKT